MVTEEKIKSFPILYKYTNRGQIQTWQIFAQGDKFWTVEGIKDGKLTTSLPTVCLGKNQSKKNETTPQEQAIAEAEAKFTKKKDKSYNEVLTDEKNFFEPMLADDFKKAKDVWDRWDKNGAKVKVFVQPKLDGLRNINEKNTQMSRNGKEYVACPHLNQNDTILDGELYNHEFKDDFNKIVSLCKKTKPEPEDIKEAAEKVQYWIYDFPSHKGKFSDRYEALKKWLVKNPNPSFVLVPTYEVKSEEDLKKRHEEFLAAGFEGTIVRLDLGDYENKRSKQLLKYKDFTDEEFEIIDAEEGTGGRVGTIGFFWMWLDKTKPYDIKNQINCFKSNVKGDFDFLKDIWTNYKKYIGTEGTVKYFNRTPLNEDGTGNKPRFPYIIKLNRKEYE